MKNVAIIGVGLIGGSLGLALKRRKKYKIIGIGRNLERLRYAKKCGAIDEISVDFGDGVRNADIVVFATPVSTYSKIAEKIKPFLKEDTIIFDVGSTKCEVTNLLTKVLGKNFVGAHPIAGSEKTGVEYARADLFENSICVLTPTFQTNKKAVQIVQKLFTDIGSKTIQMSPSGHDKTLAITSHLPHITAVSLTLLLSPQAKSLIGNGFRDTTRIAAGSPQIWVDICKTNRKNLIDACGKIIENISTIKDLLQKEDWGKLFIEFDKAKKLRGLILNHLKE